MLQAFVESLDVEETQERPGGPRRCPLTTCASEKIRLDIRECAEGPNGPGGSWNRREKSSTARM